MLSDYENMPMQIIEFEALKIENFHLKNFDFYNVFAQNIDCGYTLEPPCPQSMFSIKNKKNRYNHINPSFIQ